LGTNIGVIQIDILGFAEDLNLIGDSMEMIEQNKISRVKNKSR
jgi:hypothetical protein